MNTIFTILQELKNNSSLNTKLEILNTNKDVKYLKEFFYYSLNPDFTFGIKKIPEINSSQKDLNYDNFFELCDKFRERKITGNAAIKALSEMLDCNIEDQYIIKCIIKRKPDCGVNIQLVNKIWNNLITLPIQLMKAQAYSLKALSEIHFPAISQRKCDGARCLAFKIDGTVELYSSGNKCFHGLNDLIKNILELPEDNIVIDGELLVHENGKAISRKEGNGILNSSIHDDKGTNYSNVHMTFWDFIPLNDYYNSKGTIEYKNTIEKYGFINMSNLHFVEQQIVNNKSEAIKHFREMLSRGEEGTIIKNIDSKWENKRSKNCVKMKIIQEFTLRLFDIVEGTGKYENSTGSIICRSEDGFLQVNVGSGFSDDFRKEIWNNKEIIKQNKPLVEVLCNGIIESESKDTYSLFLPRFVEFRSDKLKADDINYIKALSDGSAMLVE